MLRLLNFAFLLIRSLIFNILFFLILAHISVCFRFLAKENLKKQVIKWVGWIDKCLKFFIGLSYRVEGRLPDYPVLYAARHESTWETVIFFIIFKANPFVLKEELIKIPLFGNFLLSMNMVPVNRNNPHDLIKTILRESKKIFESGENLIIFPEATRKFPGIYDEISTAGLYAIYKVNNVPIIPIVLNSGRFWGKRSFIKYPGLIRVKFLEEIRPGLSKEEFHKVYNEAMDRGVKTLNVKS